MYQLKLSPLYVLLEVYSVPRSEVSGSSKRLLPVLIREQNNEHSLSHQRLYQFMCHTQEAKTNYMTHSQKGEL